MGYRKSFLCLFALLSLFLFVSQNATAGGGKAYPNGAEAFMVGAMPPPGLTFINYAYYGHAGKKKDDHGDEMHIMDNADVAGDIVRLIWISKYRLLGGNYGQHAFFGMINQDFDFHIPVGPKLKTHYHDFNALYVIYSPLLIGWHLQEGKLHLAISGSDIYIPFYNEDKGNLASVSRNFWTFEPVLAVTYLPIPPLELSAKFMYDFNTYQRNYVSGIPFMVNRDPGQEFHFDFNVSWGIADNWRAGINGYFYAQTTSDDYDNIEDAPAPLRPALKAEEENKSRAIALGPGIMYKHKNIMATLRYQHEFAVRNKPELQNVWFKIIYIF